MSGEKHGDLVVQGTTISGDDPEILRIALDQAFDYRGDVTILRRNGSRGLSLRSTE
ncbi:MAG: hypothetical protein O3A19_12670 [Planctomycetota bacterium]|nr:hypothetical protein [Planctomycetota bacterium]